MVHPLTDTQIWGLEESVTQPVECPLKHIDGTCPAECAECIDFEQQNYPQITQMSADFNLSREIRG